MIRIFEIKFHKSVKYSNINLREDSMKNGQNPA